MFHASKSVFLGIFDTIRCEPLSHRIWLIETLFNSWPMYFGLSFRLVHIVQTACSLTSKFNHARRCTVNKTFTYIFSMYITLHFAFIFLTLTKKAQVVFVVYCQFTVFTMDMFYSGTPLPRYIGILWRRPGDVSGGAGGSVGWGATGGCAREPMGPI